MLYGLCDEWTARRQLIGSLGGEPDQLADTLNGPADADVDDGGPASDPTADRAAARAAQIAALARAFQ